MGCFERSRGRGGYGRFTFAVAGEAEVDEVDAAALGDESSVVDNGLGAGEAGGGGDGGCLVEAWGVDV